MRAFRRGELAEAESLLIRLKEVDPLSVATRGSELEWLVKMERYGEATTLAHQLLQQFPGSPRIQFLAGELAYRQKQYPQAEAFFRESHTMTPHWRSYFWLGRTLTQLGKFDEALPILESIEDRVPRAKRDLAWLFERKGDFDRAISYLQAVQEKNPQDTACKAQIARLKAKKLDPAQLVDEIQSLLDLGEPLPPHLLPDYVERLFQTGHGDTARTVIAEHEEGLTPGKITSLAWICFRAQAYDCAFQLFTKSLGQNIKKHAFLTSMEAAAKKCNQVDTLIDIYETHANQEKKLYGRIKSLQSKGQGKRG